LNTRWSSQWFAGTSPAQSAPASRPPSPSSRRTGLFFQQPQQQQRGGPGSVGGGGSNSSLYGEWRGCAEARLGVSAGERGTRPQTTGGRFGENDWDSAPFGGPNYQVRKIISNRKLNHSANEFN